MIHMATSLELPVAPESAAEARRFVRENSKLDSMRFTETDLLVTELVGNAVQHSKAELLEVSVEMKEHSAEISVSHPASHGLTNPKHGVGFTLLERVSKAWGTGFDDGRLTVWFRVRSPGAITVADGLSDSDLFTMMDDNPATYSDELVRRHKDLALGISNRYRGKGIADDDLHQVALMSLLKAIQRFDPSLGELRAYAAATVSGEMKKLLRDRGWSVRVPRSMQEKSLAVGKALEELTHKKDRAPELDELAKHLDWTTDEVAEALETRKAYSSRSIDAPSEHTELAIVDRLGELDGRLSRTEDRTVLEDAITRLPERQREILSLRFNDDLTQSEIADRVGISQMHVSRLLARALETLREELE